MSGLGVLAVAIVVTYLLRIAFVVFVPPEHLPAPVLRGLTYVGPAAAATLATVAVLNGIRSGAGPVVHLAALAVAIVVARWRGSTGATVAAAVATAWVVQVLV